MLKIEKILILKSGHSLTTDNIKCNTFADDVRSSPSEIFTIVEQAVILNSIQKIIEFLKIKQGAEVYFISGREATSSHFRLQLDPMFVGAYRLSFKQFKSCCDAASVLASIEQTRSHITDAFNAHHCQLDLDLGPIWTDYLKKYDRRISELYEKYGAKEMARAEAVICKNLSSIW